MTAKRERKCPMADVPSLDVRVTGPVAKPKSQKSTNHTIAPAYNKGPSMVVGKKDIKDIGR